MATTPEGKVKRLVKTMLARQPYIYSFWPVQTGMGSRTLDCIGVFRGQGFAIECKAEGLQLTEQQEWIKQKMELAGTRVFVVNTSDTQAQCWTELLAFLLLP
jgi:hypothetical protein